jgi:phenylacetic acid degradation protein
MNSVVMDNAVVGENTIVGALTFIPAETEVPPGKVVGGNPFAILRDVSQEMLLWKLQGTELYQTLPERYRSSMRPARAGRVGRPRKQEAVFTTWKETERRRGHR